MHNGRTKSNLVHLNEYLTSDIFLDNAEPIPFVEQTELMDVFYLKAKDYSESDWKDETLIVADSSLSKLMEYDPQEANQLLHKTHFLPKAYLFKKKLLKIAMKLYYDVDLSYSSTSYPKEINFTYRPTSTQEFVKSKQIDNYNPYSFGVRTRYKFNRKFDVNYYYYYYMGSVGAHLSELKFLGFAYETPLINQGRQLLLMCGVNYFFSQDGYHIGDFSSESTFKAGGKKN